MGPTNRPKSPATILEARGSIGMQRYILCRLQRLKLPWRCLRKFRNWYPSTGSDCNGTCNVEYVQHYMLRYYAIRAYKFALEVSNKQSLFGVPHSSRSHALREAPVSTGRAAREPEVFSPALQSELFGTRVPGSECPARFERTPCEESDNFDHILLFI